MKQLTLFDIDTQSKKETQMTWLELYNYLHSRANDIHNLNKNSRFWNLDVKVHDAVTGDELSCDTFEISDNEGEQRLVLMINIDQM